MVRIIAQGLLILGIMPVTLVNSTVITTNNQNQVFSKSPAKIDEPILNSSCATVRLPKKCLPTIPTVKKSEIHSDLWLQEITHSLLSDSWFAESLFLLSKSKKQEQKYKKYNFDWQKKLERKSINLDSIKLAKLTSEHHTSQNDHSPPKFPQLSRSSLIVSFPQDNSSFVPINTKLANPAPETKRIASPFGWRRRPYSNQLQFHQGIDYGAPFSSPVVAVGNGIVTRVVSGCADFDNLFCGGQLGNWIEIDHGNGTIGTYGHLKSNSITVKAGMKVRKNQKIAQVGSSGWSTGAHLDFRLEVNGKHEDPAHYVMAIESKKSNLR